MSQISRSALRAMPFILTHIAEKFRSFFIKFNSIITTGYTPLKPLKAKICSRRISLFKKVWLAQDKINQNRYGLRLEKLCST